MLGAFDRDAYHPDLFASLTALRAAAWLLSGREVRLAPHPSDLGDTNDTAKKRAVRLFPKRWAVVYVCAQCVRWRLPDTVAGAVRTTGMNLAGVASFVQAELTEGFSL